MSANKHTPGKWTAECVGTTSAGPDGEDVYEVHADGMVRVCEFVRERDAALIAAAPDLLAALRKEDEWRAREAVGELDESWDYDVMVGQYRRAAIAKATGGAS